LGCYPGSGGKDERKKTEVFRPCADREGKDNALLGEKTITRGGGKALHTRQTFKGGGGISRRKRVFGNFWPANVKMAALGLSGGKIKERGGNLRGKGKRT